MIDKELYLLHAKSKSFKRKVEQSTSVIKDFLEITNNPYISWSTGKDSTAVLGLTRQIKNVVAVHLDNGVELPGTDDVRQQIDNVIHHKSEVDFLTIAEIYGLGSKETLKANFFDEFEKQYDFDGVLMGLRADESVARGFNAKRGMIYQKKNGMYVCNPILHWSITDVFAYLISEKLPIHPHYLLPGPFPIEGRRVGSYVSSRNRGAQFGRFTKLKYFYPDLYYELTEKFPELKKYT